jgi:hypothetical protein
VGDVAPRVDIRGVRRQFAIPAMAFSKVVSLANYRAANSIGLDSDTGGGYR